MMSASEITSSLPVWLVKFLRRVNGFLRWAVHLGVQESQPWQLKIRIKMMNRILLSLIPMLTLVIINAVWECDPTGGIMGLVLILMSAGSMVLISRGRHQTAWWLFSAPMFVILGVLSATFGRDAGLHTSFLVGGIGAVVVFERVRTQRVMLAVMVLSFALSEWYLNENGPIYPVSYGHRIYLITFLTNFMGIVAMLIYLGEMLKRHLAQYEALYQELAQKKQRLQETNHELKQFAYTASHHFKSPLKNITSLLGLIESKFWKDLPERSREYLGMIKEDSRHLFHLTEDILAYSRLEKNESPAKPKELTQLGPVIDRIRQNLADLLHEKNGRIEVRALPAVWINEFHAELLLQNLVQNGLKYNQSPEPVVVIEGMKRGLETHISVTDNGIGIDPAYHEKVFEVYSRLHNREEYEGSGIGLSICKKLIEGYGGTLALSSQPGMGTQMSIMLPAEGIPTQMSQR